MQNPGGPPGGIVPMMPSSASTWQSMASKPTTQAPKPRTTLANQTLNGPSQRINQQGYPLGHFPATPLPPPARVAVPTIPQAFYTSYPSRIRSGATLLTQPILSTSAAGGAIPGVGGASNSAAAAPGHSTRRRGPVSYAEAGSGDEFESPPEKGAGNAPIDSDDSDFQASGGTRTTVRKMGRGPNSAAVQNAKLMQATEGKEKVEVDKSYLGLVPPPNLVIPKPAHTIRSEYIPLERIVEQAEQPTILIPIRIELDTETARIRDCFTWNLNEKLISPNQFAQMFCADLDLHHAYIERVANQMLAQIEEHTFIAGMPLPTNAEREGEILHEDDAGPGDCRVILQIDVQISTKHLLDHIEWDLRSDMTPEEFTASLCAELGLTSEAKPMIAHAIHEELLKHKKDVIEWGVLEGGGEWKSHAAGLGNAWGRKGKGPKRMKGIWRDWGDILSGEYAPRIDELTAEELEKREMERERAARRLRRETSKFQGVGATARRRR